MKLLDKDLFEILPPNYFIKIIKMVENNIINRNSARKLIDYYISLYKLKKSILESYDENEIIKYYKQHLVIEKNLSNNET